MAINIFCNVTEMEATVDMIDKIDNSDFLMTHIVLVPDRFSLQCEKLLLERKGNALFNIQVRSLTRFTQELLDEMEIDQADVLSSGQTLLLTEQAISNVLPSLKFFKKNKIAFAYEINKLISQFKSCNVTPDELSAKEGQLAAAKYSDLKTIYEEYNRLLEGRLDVNGRLEKLIDNFKEIELFKHIKIYFAGFDAFTSQSWRLAEKLAKVCDCNFAVAKNQNIGNEYIYIQDVFSNILALAKEDNLLVNVIQNSPDFSPEQNAIVKGVYSYKKTKCDSGHFNLFSAVSVSEEVEAVAKLIRYKVYNGLKYKDIVVAASDLSLYSAYIDNIFTKYNIPYFIDLSLTADQTLLGRLVLEMIDCSSNMCGDRLISLLSCPLLGDNSALIEKCQKLNIDSKQKYKKYIEKEFAFASFACDFERAKSAGEMSKITKEFLQSVQENFDNIMQRLEDEGKIKERNINIQIPQIILQCLDLICDYDRDLDAEEFRKKLKLLLSFKEVSSVPSYVDGVMIGDATSSFFGNCDSLIIMGGESLPISSLDNGLLSDEEMNLNIKEISPTIKMINRRNRFRIFSLLTIAKNSLTIFYQFFSDDGKKNELPSYISSLCSIFDVMEIKAGHIFFDKSPLTAARAKLSASPRFSGEKMYNKWLLSDKISLLESDILRVTEIENYFNCPFQHFVRYVLKLKEKEDFELSPSDIGNICHKAAEIFVSKLMKNFDLDVDVDKTAKEILPKAIDEMTAQKLSLLDEADSLKKFLHRQVKNLFKEIVRDLKKSSFKPYLLEKNLEQQISVDGRNFVLIGRADRIDEAGDYFRIIDYKTGGTGNVLKDLYFGQKLQLFLYQDMAQKFLNKTMAGGYYFSAKLDYSNSEDEKVILKGLAPDDEQILLLLDSDIENGKSELHSIAKAAKGGFKGSGVTHLKLNDLAFYSVKVTGQAIRELLQGELEAKPCQDACKYCKAKPLCEYERSMGQRVCDKHNFKGEQ